MAENRTEHQTLKFKQSALIQIVSGLLSGYKWGLTLLNAPTNNIIVQTIPFYKQIHLLHVEDWEEKGI